MANSRKHESEDLRDSEVLDANDTLMGDPGDDPLDRGVAAPDRWSAGVKYALQGEEDSESLDELLAEEEPDVLDDEDDEDEDDEESWEEPAPRAGRLATTEADVYGEGDVDLPAERDDELIAKDTGIDGGAASAEEAAVHLEEDR